MIASVVIIRVDDRLVRMIGNASATSSRTPPGMLSAGTAAGVSRTADMTSTPDGDSGRQPRPRPEDVSPAGQQRRDGSVRLASRRGNMSGTLPRSLLARQWRVFDERRGMIAAACDL